MTNIGHTEEQLVQTERDHTQKEMTMIYLPFAFRPSQVLGSWVASSMSGLLQRYLKNVKEKAAVFRVRCDIWPVNVQEQQDVLWLSGTKQSD